MALIRWEPFREMTGLQQEMNRLFDTLTPRIDGSSRANATSFLPAAEMHETPDTIELKVEVPGMDPKDIDIQVSAEAVSIRGERRSEKEVAEKGMARSEFRYGSFQRIIPLSARIQNDQVQADYTNGVLRLTLPKAEAEKSKVVRISLGDQTQQGNGQAIKQSQGNGQTASQPQGEPQSV